MSARPATWDLDMPPPSLLAPVKKIPPGRDVPSLRKLRASLTGTRFEMLKVSTFAAFLLALVGVVVQTSQITNPDNQFAATAAAAMKDLTGVNSDQIARLRDALKTFSSALTCKVQVAEDHFGGNSRIEKKAARMTIQKADVLAVAPIARRAPNHHQLNAAKPAHSRSAAQKAGRGFFDGLSSYATTLRDAASRPGSLVAPDSLLAGVAALFLYALFVIVLVYAKGGKRAFAGTHTR